MKNQLGRLVETVFGAQLACQSTSWSSEGQIDATWWAKRHQVGAQRGFGSAQGGAKRAKRGTETIDAAATGVRRGYVFGRVARPK